MRHVHAKVWPGGKRPPGPIVKAGTIYQRSPHSSLIWIVKFVRIFIAEKCSSGQQGKVFGSWVVVKFPKQKLTSCLMVGVATRRSATMFCIFKVSWLVVCFSCARARTDTCFEAGNLVRDITIPVLKQVHWISLNVLFQDARQWKRQPHQRSQRFDRLRAIVVCCWIWGATWYIFFIFYFLCVCESVCCICIMWC